MASSTADNINLPRLPRQSVPVANVPQVRVAQTDGGASALYSIGDLLRGVSRNLENRLDVEAKLEGARSGTLAGMQDDLPDLMDERTIRGEAFNMAAKDAAITRLDVQGRLKLSEIEEKHKADPAGFKQEADSYLQGVATELVNFDPGLSQKYAADYALRQDAALQRVTERHQVILRDNQLEGALRLQMALGDEMSTQAASLFSGDAINAQKTLTAMTSNAVRMVDVAHQIGPDGRPLFGARERLAFEADAEESVANKVALAWMATQPDMITAYQTWSAGKAEIAVADPERKQTVKMPLKQMLGESAYTKAQGAFVSQLKSQLALDAQIDSARDRDFKQGSDQAFSDLSVQAQNGSLQLNAVEAAKTQLEPDKYLALRSLAKSGGASVSDGQTLTRLTTADIDGRNITDELRQEYDAGKITRQDFMQLYERNSSRLSQGQKDPISQGRDLVTGSLGRLSSELGLAQSLLISEAEADYALRIDDMVRAKRRLRKEGEPDVTQKDLTLRETLDVARQVKDRYSVMAGEKASVALELPEFMTASQKFSSTLGEKELSEVARKTREHYLAKNRGDEKALRDDQDYQRQSQLIQKYFDVLKFKGVAGNGGPAAKQ